MWEHAIISTQDLGYKLKSLTFRLPYVKTLPLVPSDTGFFMCFAFALSQHYYYYFFNLHLCMSEENFVHKATWGRWYEVRQKCKHTVGSEYNV